jgi:hypothetical protein
MRNRYALDLVQRKWIPWKFTSLTLIRCFNEPTINGDAVMKDALRFTGTPHGKMRYTVAGGLLDII